MLTEIAEISKVDHSDIARNAGIIENFLILDMYGKLLETSGCCGQLWV